jgi:MFS transporter, DHA1 family, multidrug resistance protein
MPIARPATPPDAALPDPAPGLTLGRFHAIVAVAGVAFGFTAPLTAVFASALGAGAILAGAAVSSAALSVFVIDIFGTRWTPRLEARRAVTVALVIFGAGSLATAFAGSYPMMLAARVFQGVGVALFLGVGPQLAIRLGRREAVGGRLAGRALGSFNAAWFTGIALGPLLGGWVSGFAAGAAGLRLAFAVCGVLSGLIAVLVWVTFPRTASGRPPKLGLPVLQRIGGGRAYAVLATGGLGQAVRSGIAMTVLPIFGSQVLGLSSLWLGITLSCLAVTDVLAMGLAARLSDARGRLPVLLAACVWGAAATAGLLAISTELWFLLLCTAIGLTVGVAWVVPAAMAVDVIDDAETALASYRISADIGLMTGGLASGVAISGLGVSGALVAGVIHLLLIAVAAVVVRETRKPTALSAAAVLSAPTILGGPVMPVPEPPPPVPTPELFDALVVDQGLDFLSAERRLAALDTHLAMRSALLKLRAVPLNFLEPVAEPASALAWLESAEVVAR